jgi:hypothetical protein
MFMVSCFGLSQAGAHRRVGGRNETHTLPKARQLPDPRQVAAKRRGLQRRNRPKSARTAEKAEKALQRRQIVLNCTYKCAMLAHCEPANLNDTE